jgi:hypothetical protein
MAKIKASRGKAKASTPQRGVGCIVMVVLAMLIAILLMIYVMGHANQT